jgi:hypothetical protein
VSAANSAYTSAGDDHANASPNPSAAASPAAICQSGRAAPGGSSSLRTSPTRRSELVIVPSFSGHAAAGRTACASADVSVG